MEIPRLRTGFEPSRTGARRAPISPEILSGAAGMRGVRSVLYGGASRQSMRVALAGLLDPGATLGPCRLDRAKFKPGRKLTGYFVVSVRTADGVSSRAVEVVWSDEDGATPEPGAADLQEEARAVGILAPFRSLREQIPGLRISVAPLDASFPHLVRLSDPRRVQQMLAETYRRHGGSTAVAEDYLVSTVRYRPRQRHLLRYEPRPSGAGVFAKLYAPGKAAEAMRVAAVVADAVEQADAGVGAVRPLGDVPLDDVVLYPRLEGKPLSAYLARAESVPRRPLHAAGALLRSLHEHGLGRPDVATLDLRRNNLPAELPATARAAEHLGPLVPDVAAQIDVLLTRAGELDAKIPGEPAAFAHGDFKCDHLWVSRRGLTVLDFDTCSLAEPALDVGKFLADLSWHYTRHGGTRHDAADLRQAQQAFLDGYGTMPGGRLARSRLVELVIFTKISIRRRRRFQPDFEQGVRADLSQAVARLRSIEGDAP